MDCMAESKPSASGGYIEFQFFFIKEAKMVKLKGYGIFCRKYINILLRKFAIKNVTINERDVVT